MFIIISNKNSTKKILLFLTIFVFLLTPVQAQPYVTCVDLCEDEGFDVAGCTRDNDPCDNFPYCSNFHSVCRYDCTKYFSHPTACSILGDGDYECYCWQESACDCTVGCCRTNDCSNAGVCFTPEPRDWHCTGDEFCNDDCECICPNTCSSLGYECGTCDDGCGGTITCTDACGEGYYCGDNCECVADDCEPQTCNELGYECGTCIDNCGESINCPNTCEDGYFCNEDCECELGAPPPPPPPECTDRCDKGDYRCRKTYIIQKCKKTCDNDPCTEWCKYKDCRDENPEYVCRNDNKCVDGTAPITSIFCNDDMCYEGCWYTEPVSISFSCSDGASGCDKTYYCYAKDDTCDLFTEYSGPFDLPKGTSYVRYYSKDFEKNKESTKSQEIKIDTDLEGKMAETMITVINLGADRKPIHLSYSISPYTNDINVVFERNPIPVGEVNSLMKITANYGASGDYIITVTGVADSILRTVTYSLTVI